MKAKTRVLQPINVYDSLVISNLLNNARNVSYPCDGNLKAANFAKLKHFIIKRIVHT